MSAHGRTFTSIFAPLALAVALFGCGELTPEVGKCTNTDPDRLVDLDVTIVECDASDATTKLTKKAKNASECESGRLTFDEDIYCTEPLKK